MKQDTLPQYSDPYLEGGFWKIRWRETVSDGKGMEKEHLQEPVFIGPATGPNGLTETEAQRIAWKNLLSAMQQSTLDRQSKMTIASFVESKFVPEHVAVKMSSSRTYYRAMLKHILTPEEVDRVFRSNLNKSRKRLEAVPNWPYLSDVRLCDAGPDQVHRLLSAAKERGYSIQTVNHIRNVLSAIFMFAKQERCFMGDNPVSLAVFSETARSGAPGLAFSEAKTALHLMKHPEKEIMLMAVLVDINLSEICGLQWKRVNLTGAELVTDGVRIQPRTIAVRKQWYRDKLGDVSRSRIRNLPISPLLLQILSKLKDRDRFTSSDDFVFVSRLGTPVNQNNVVERRLKPLAKQLGVPSLSWQAFRRARKALGTEFASQMDEFMEASAGFEYPLDKNQRPWDTAAKSAWTVADSGRAKKAWGAGPTLLAYGD